VSAFPPENVADGFTKDYTPAPSKDALPPPEYATPLPISKHTRVRLEALRSLCAAVSAFGTIAVLLHIYGIA
jgi:hypothetical protein